MITTRKSSDRGHFDHGWLNAKHTFSFGRYIDRDHTHFGSLRVINEDVIAPKMGFGEHGHENMEIITYPLAGTVRHADSLGNHEDITPGMIQRMSAGAGIRHSEFNPSPEPTHMLQIWITPREDGLRPTHDSKSFPVHTETGRFHLLASSDGADGSLIIQQDARMWAGVFDAGDDASFALDVDKKLWIHVARGCASINGRTLNHGDAAGVQDEPAVNLSFTENAEVLVFEVGA